MVKIRCNRPAPTHNTKVTYMKVTDLKFDVRNYRKHGDKNKKLIRKSIQEVGLGRSIVVDANNEIVAGNGLVSQLDKDTPVRVVETTGGGACGSKAHRPANGGQPPESIGYI
nr:MAG TPA: ParB protein [Caudoviricetes sp.]